MLETGYLFIYLFLQDLHLQKEKEKRVGWTLQEPNMGLSFTATQGGVKDR